MCSGALEAFASAAALPILGAQSHRSSAFCSMTQMARRSLELTSTFSAWSSLLPCQLRFTMDGRIMVTCGDSLAPSRGCALCSLRGGCERWKRSISISASRTWIDGTLAVVQCSACSACKLSVAQQTFAQARLHSDDSFGWLSCLPTTCLVEGLLSLLGQLHYAYCDQLDHASSPRVRPRDVQGSKMLILIQIHNVDQLSAVAPGHDLDHTPFESNLLASPGRLLQ